MKKPWPVQKKIVELRKNEIKQGVAKKHKYVAIKDRICTLLNNFMVVHKLKEGCR